MGTSCSASVRIVDYGGNERHYEKFADEFLEHAEDGFANAYIDRPACLELLGDVRGKRVLDAACGPGLYAAELLRRGAGVTGFDASPRMVEICRDRVPAGTFRVHDLGRPLDTSRVHGLPAGAGSAFGLSGSLAVTSSVRRRQGACSNVPVPAGPRHRRGQGK
jgi:SAM-dependent methyltransferase